MRKDIMATSLIPDPSNQNPPETDPNLNNPSVPITTDMERLIQSTLGEAERMRREAEQRARDAEDELARLRSQQSTPPIPQNTENPQDFWNNPQKNISELIQAQVKPLFDSAAAVQREREYAAFKVQYRSYPGFTAIEPTVDQFMAGQEITHANMQAMIQRAVGFLLLNNPQVLQTAVPNNPPAPSVNPPVNNQRTPDVQAHLRPSNQPPAGGPNNKPTRRALNEQEKRIMKEMNLTEDKYWALLESQAKVNDWKAEGK